MSIGRTIIFHASSCEVSWRGGKSEATAVTGRVTLSHTDACGRLPFRCIQVASSSFTMPNGKLSASAKKKNKDRWDDDDRMYKKGKPAVSGQNRSVSRRSQAEEDSDPDNPRDGPPSEPEGEHTANERRHQRRLQVHLIPKPKGEAGRAPPRGYNLQEAMGLQDHNSRYNRLTVTFTMHICGLYSNSNSSACSPTNGNQAPRCHEDFEAERTPEDD